MSGTSPAPCPLCGRECKRRLQKSGHDIHRCAACDFEFVHPVPERAALDAVYQRGYFCGPGHGYPDYFATERASNRKKATVRLERLAGLGIGAGARLLDVGCADGVFLAEALARGLDAHGVEVSAEALQALPAELRERVHGSLATAESASAWTAITLWDVLEHLADFLETLRRLRAMLVPGGVLAVVVPVIDNFNARWLPGTWDQYKPPEHLWYFSRKSLRATLERYVGPVVGEESAWQRYARFLDVGYQAKGPVSRSLRAAERTVWRLTRSLGLVAPERLEDSVAMYARAGDV